MRSIIQKIRPHSFTVVSITALLLFVVLVIMRINAQVLPVQQIPVITTAAAVNADVSDAERFTGILQPEREVDLAAKTGGSIVALYADVGARVFSAQTLAELDGTTARATRDGLNNSIAVAEKGVSAIDRYYKEQIRTEQTSGGPIPSATDTGSSQTASVAALTNAAILSDQVSDILGTLLSVQNGKDSSIEITFDNELGVRNTAAKMTARETLMAYQLANDKFQNYFHGSILNKDPSQSAVDLGLTEAVAVLTNSKVVLSQAYAVLSGSVAASSASGAEISSYKTNVTMLGGQVQSLLQNIHDVSTSVILLERIRDTKLAEAQSQIVALKGQTDVTDTILADGVIHASFGGLITKKYVEQGAVIAPGTPLFHLVDDSVLKLSIGVPDDRVSLYHVGDTATIVSDLLSERTFVAVITRIDPSADPVSKKVTMELSIANGDHALKVGSYAHVAFEKAHSASVAIPRSALLLEYGSVYVFVFDGKVVHRRMVTVGAESTELIEIISGLTSGDIVATAGHRYLRDDDVVTTISGNTVYEN